MSFVTEKEELKPGLILFRRGDVDHRMWYCRMKADRHKTVSLKTSDKEAARERAFDQDADVRFRIKHDVPVFNRPFRDVAHEYLLTQEARAKRGEISAARPKKLRAVIEGTLDRYAGSTQVHLIGDERWGGYVRERSCPECRLGWFWSERSPCAPALSGRSRVGLAVWTRRGQCYPGTV
jgi:integrase